MKKMIRPKLFSTVIICFVLAACAKQPETIVVDESPTPSASETPRDTADTGADAEFRRLSIGELHPVPTLDPLFAGNNSSKRVVQLVYEGLVKYDENGSVEPLLADRWKVSGDSLTYTFTLRDNVFYHDSNVFGSGIGRKVRASDVKFVLERMAKNTVPESAARLFMDIEGFDPYFQEQHRLLNPAYRSLDEVTGIMIQDDRTIEIRLAEKDPHFLHKLASPFAVIYPPEAVTKTVGAFKAVGTGPFELSQQRGDSVYIFSNFDKYWNTGETGTTELDRVDVIIKSRESSLFRLLTGGEIHLIPELGPDMMASILDTQGNLAIGYRDSYIYGRTGGEIRYSLRYHEGSRVSIERVRSLLVKVNFADLFAGIPGNLIRFRSEITSQASDTLDTTPVSVTYTEDPFLLKVIRDISSDVNTDQTVFQVDRVRIPNRNTALYSQTFVPQYPGQQAPGNGVRLINLSVTRSYLYNSQIQNLTFNDYSWWIDLREVTLPEFDRL